MTPDDEIFRQFIAKALEIQAQKNDQGLSTEEMQQVAASMGITTADLEAAFNAYWQRGSGFARLNNWDDAIAQLEQAVALKPDQPKALYALAQAYRQRWELTRDRADQTQALALANRCAELDPHHFEALKLISELKASPEAAPANPARTRGILLLASGLLLLGIGLLAMFWLITPEPSGGLTITQPTDEETAELAQTPVPSNVSVKESFALLGDRGPVYWAYTEARHTEGGSEKWTKDYYLHLINPRSGDTLKTITLLLGGEYYKNPRENTDIFYLGGKVYEIREKEAKFVARDLYSGDIVDDETQLAQRYPALGAGIGKLDFFNGWFEIVTTKGEKYWYSPKVNKFGSDTEKLETNRDYKGKKGWAKVKNWVFTQGDIKKLYLIDDQVSPYQMMYSSRPTTYEESEDMLMLRYRAGHTSYMGVRQIPNRTFIAPRMVYASSALAVILHASEVGANAKPLLTCLDSAGNLRWYNEAPPVRFFTNTEGAVSLASNAEVYYHADKLAINVPNVYNDGKHHHYACELDLKTGRVNWEYSPTGPLNQ